MKEVNTMDEVTVYKVLRRMVTAGHLTDAFRHHGEKEGLCTSGTTRQR
jgi:hypothetical protein